MLIGKNWKIESDPLNVTLLKRRMSKPKDGSPPKETWGPVGFYSTVNNALKDMVNFEVRGTGLSDLKTVQAKIEELYKLIDKVSK